MSGIGLMYKPSAEFRAFENDSDFKGKVIQPVTKPTYPDGEAPTSEGVDRRGCCAERQECRGDGSQGFP
jgi:hypothetical protein